MSTIEASVPAEVAELSPYAPTRSSVEGKPLSEQELHKIETYWKTCNYLSLGMIYLQENPLLTGTTAAGAPEESPAGALGHRVRGCRSSIFI